MRVSFYRSSPHIICCNTNLSVLSSPSDSIVCYRKWSTMNRIADRFYSAVITVNYNAVGVYGLGYLPQYSFFSYFPFLFLHSNSWTPYRSRFPHEYLDSSNTFITVVAGKLRVLAGKLRIASSSFFEFWITFFSESRFFIFSHS